VLAPDDEQFEALGLARAGVAIARAGGATRADSVAGGLDALLALGADVDDWVLVHDAARCLVRPESVRRLIEACREDAVGGLLALPVADTLKRSTAESARGERVEVTVPRTAIWAAQTPQMFRIGLLRDALRAGLARADLSITDEASAIEALGLQPRLVRGELENLKVTWPEDFTLAERLLRAR
jgi:2-C-methyl-D-erythritol 4-phosphate cytidylyltransferase